MGASPARPLEHPSDFGKAGYARLPADRQWTSAQQNSFAKARDEHRRKGALASNAHGKWGDIMRMRNVQHPVPPELAPQLAGDYNFDVTRLSRQETLQVMRALALAYWGMGLSPNATAEAHRVYRHSLRHLLYEPRDIDRMAGAPPRARRHHGSVHSSQVGSADDDDDDVPSDWGTEDDDDDVPSDQEAEDNDDDDALDLGSGTPLFDVPDWSSVEGESRGTLSGQTSSTGSVSLAGDSDDDAHSVSDGSRGTPSGQTSTIGRGSRRVPSSVSRGRGASLRAAGRGARQRVRETPPDGVALVEAEEDAVDDRLADGDGEDVYGSSYADDRLADEAASSRRRVLRQEPSVARRGRGSSLGTTGREVRQRLGKGAPPDHAFDEMSYKPQEAGTTGREVRQRLEKQTFDDAELDMAGEDAREPSYANDRLADEAASSRRRVSRQEPPVASRGRSAWSRNTNYEVRQRLGKAAPDDYELDENVHDPREVVTTGREVRQRLGKGAPDDYESLSDASDHREEPPRRPSRIPILARVHIRHSPVQPQPPPADPLPQDDADLAASLLHSLSIAPQHSADVLVPGLESDSSAVIPVPLGNGLRGTSNNLFDEIPPVLPSGITPSQSTNTRRAPTPQRSEIHSDTEDEQDFAMGVGSHALPAPGHLAELLAATAPLGASRQGPNTDHDEAQMRVQRYPSSAGFVQGLLRHSEAPRVVEKLAETQRQLVQLEETQRQIAATQDDDSPQPRRGRSPSSKSAGNAVHSVPVEDGHNWDSNQHGAGLVNPGQTSPTGQPRPTSPVSDANGWAVVDLSSIRHLIQPASAPQDGVVDPAPLPEHLADALGTAPHLTDPPPRLDTAPDESEEATRQELENDRGVLRQLNAAREMIISLREHGVAQHVAHDSSPPAPPTPGHLAETIAAGPEGDASNGVSEMLGTLGLVGNDALASSLSRALESASAAGSSMQLPSSIQQRERRPYGLAQPESGRMKFEGAHTPPTNTGLFLTYSGNDPRIAPQPPVIDQTSNMIKDAAATGSPFRSRHQGTPPKSSTPHLSPSVPLANQTSGIVKSPAASGSPIKSRPQTPPSSSGTPTRASMPHHSPSVLFDSRPLDDMVRISAATEPFTRGHSPQSIPFNGIRRGGRPSPGHDTDLGANSRSTGSTPRSSRLDTPNKRAIADEFVMLRDLGRQLDIAQERVAVFVANSPGRSTPEQIKEMGAVLGGIQDVQGAIAHLTQSENSSPSTPQQFGKLQETRQNLSTVVGQISQFAESVFPVTSEPSGVMPKGGTPPRSTSLLSPHSGGASKTPALSPISALHMSGTPQVPMMTGGGGGGDPDNEPSSESDMELEDDSTDNLLASFRKGRGPADITHLVEKGHRSLADGTEDQHRAFESQYKARREGLDRIYQAARALPSGSHGFAEAALTEYCKTMRGRTASRQRAATPPTLPSQRRTATPPTQKPAEASGVSPHPSLRSPAPPLMRTSHQSLKSPDIGDIIVEDGSLGRRISVGTRADIGAAWLVDPPQGNPTRSLAFEDLVDLPQKDPTGHSDSDDIIDLTGSVRTNSQRKSRVVKPWSSEAEDVPAPRRSGTTKANGKRKSRVVKPPSSEPEAVPAPERSGIAKKYHDAALPRLGKLRKTTLSRDAEIFMNGLIDGISISEQDFKNYRSRDSSMVAETAEGHLQTIRGYMRGALRGTNFTLGVEGLVNFTCAVALQHHEGKDLVSLEPLAGALGSLGITCNDKVLWVGTCVTRNQTMREMLAPDTDPIRLRGGAGRKSAVEQLLRERLQPVQKKFSRVQTGKMARMMKEARCKDSPANTRRIAPYADGRNPAAYLNYIREVIAEGIATQNPSPQFTELVRLAIAVIGTANVKQAKQNTILLAQELGRLGINITKGFDWDEKSVAANTKALE